MLFRQIYLVLIALFVSGAAFAAGESTVNVTVARPGATATIDQVVVDGKVLVNVNDAMKNPLLGLSTLDFSVTHAGKKAKIVSVLPITESLDVPRHIVLVLDNSFSMSERNAVKPLLDGVAELLKTVRPIDDVQVVVFDSAKKIKVGNRELRVQTFKSNQPAEVQAFADKSYGKEGLTSKTTLYEAMLAGLDLVDNMPAKEPRFMVIFTDGQDLNSSYSREDVLKASESVGAFNAFAVDYMETPEADKFLSKFVGQNRGQIWKAKSETNLVSIFQSVASKMQHLYVVNYLFEPSGKLAVEPASLTIDEVRTAGLHTKIDAAALLLRPVVDSVYGIANWKITVSNAKGSIAGLAGEGNPAAELAIPLQTADMQALATGGDLAVRMELKDSKGQSLLLNSPPVKIKVVQTRASLISPPAGAAGVTIEEIKTIDASPMLGHVYFAKGSSVIPPQYIRFSDPSKTAGFDEKKFAGTLEKYYQGLNIIGKRLTDKPEAKITLVGCNDNIGKEKGNKKLSTQRAEVVRDYLKTVWNIAPERMTIVARNLPAKPSSVQLKEGQAENRRMEITSTDPALLEPIRSTYLTTRIDTPSLTLKPDVVAPYGVASWTVTVANGSETLANLSGKGAPAKEISIPLASRDLKALATGGDITVKIELQDNKGQILTLSPDPVKVTFIQTSQRLAEKQGLVVQEKYALILFDFNKDTIGAENQEIVKKIVGRIKSLPQAKVEIVGHTDNIGAEKYNQKLSERRALAVYKMLTTAYGEAPGDRIRYSGVGPKSPLFDNLSPEARSFNRTVIITVEYLSAE